MCAELALIRTWIVIWVIDYPVGSVNIEIKETLYCSTQTALGGNVLIYHIRFVKFGNDDKSRLQINPRTSRGFPRR